MNTPDNCYLDKGHDAHDLLGRFDTCPACGFSPSREPLQPEHAMPRDLAEAVARPTELAAVVWKYIHAWNHLEVPGDDADELLSEMARLVGFNEPIPSLEENLRRKPLAPPVTPEPTQTLDVLLACECSLRVNQVCDKCQLLKPAVNEAIARARHAGEVAGFRTGLENAAKIADDYDGFVASLIRAYLQATESPVVSDPIRSLAPAEKMADIDLLKQKLAAAQAEAATLRALGSEVIRSWDGRAAGDPIEGTGPGAHQLMGLGNRDYGARDPRVERFYDALAAWRTALAAPPSTAATKEGK
jgi:hypothetical protein